MLWNPWGASYLNFNFVLTLFGFAICLFVLRSVKDYIGTFVGKHLPEIL